MVLFFIVLCNILLICWYFDYAQRRMVGWIRKNLEVETRDVIEVPSRNLRGVAVNHSAAGVLIKIQSEHLPNMSAESCRLG